MADKLSQKTVEELENLYNKAMERGDEILADTIAYLISEKQQQIVNEIH